MLVNTHKRTFVNIFIDFIGLGKTTGYVYMTCVILALFSLIHSTPIRQC